MVNKFSRVPRSIMDANKIDCSDITMQIVEGSLPNDLQGHVFIVAPAGLPFKDGSPFLNGNGMIYRLDFDREGEVKLQQSLVKPPDYWADKATQEKEFQHKELLEFRNHGIVKFSLLLGSRNELNTAFLPMKFSGETNERLLVTYDAGRPYEIDTKTLEVVTPVGEMKEWEAEVTEPKHPFSLILSTAHPAFDTYKHQMFTVNYGRSLSNLLGIIPKVIKELERKLSELEANTQPSEEEQKKRLTIILTIELLSRIALNLLDKNPDFVYLIRWDGVNSLQKWRLINSNGSPVIIEQSMHQIGVTEDYVVLMDTAFATGIEQVVTNLPDIAPVEERKFVATQPSPDSIFYIVRRDDLQAGQPEVVAHKVEIPREAAHFLVDYENPNDKITVHIAHIGAWDIAEWLRRKDRFPHENGPVPDDLLGTQQGEMDISHMGRHVIDANTLRDSQPKIESTVISDCICTWGPGLYTYLERLPSSGMTPKKLDNIYWVSFGLWKELTIQFMYDQYKDYKYREVPLEQLLELAKKGIPPCLYRLHTSSMKIADYYQCPEGHMLLSPQFMPRRGGEESSTNGYIVCTAFTPERDEIWIFDAANLKRGPLCKLHAPKLNIGLSLHTAWLQNISPRQASYKIPIKQDFQELVEKGKFLDFFTLTLIGKKGQIKEEIRELFKKEIYPHFEGNNILDDNL